MGNQNAQDEKSVIVEDQEVTMNHPKLDKAKFKKTKHREYLQTAIPITNSKEYSDWEKVLSDSPASRSEFALTPLNHTFKKAGACGNSGTANISYENYPYLLSKEIKERTRNNLNKSFVEPELWYLLYGLSDATSKFHIKGEKAGDIRPENIFLNEDGLIKVATKHSWPGQLSAYEKYTFDGIKTYLSPEQVVDSIVGRDKPSGKPETAEAFSVGLTCLQVALLKNGSQLYAKDDLDEDMLQSHKNQLRSSPLYSELLKFVILSLTDRNPENRVTCQELKNFLQPNETNIKNMVPFSVNALPYKIRKTAESLNSPSKSQSFPEPISIPKYESSLPVPSTHLNTSDSHFRPTSSVTFHRSSETPISQNLESSPSNLKVQTGAENPQIRQTSSMNWDEIEEKIRKSKQMFPE